MVVKKEKQFLVFYLDDGKTVKYDLATCQTIGKSGKTVKDLRGQLRGYSVYEVIQAIEDETYKKLLTMVFDRYGVTNVGTLLDKAKYYSRYEQIFSSGVDVERGENIHGEIPKGLIKLCREHNLKLSRLLVSMYEYDPNLLIHAFSIECNHLTKEDVKKVILGGAYIHNPELSVFVILVKDYHYNVKSLLKYIDYLHGYEGIELSGYSGVVREIFDYARMARDMSNKFEKYPKNFLTVHQITSRNYNRLKRQFNELAFQERYNARFERKVDDYVFIYPKETQDIKNEAVQQGNCVASYIEDVIAGKCDILFMRKAVTPDISLVTIEVRQNRIVQAKGKYNRDVTGSELEIIKKYNTYLANLQKGGEAA